MWTIGSYLIIALATAFCVVCVFMMLVILIQKPKGGGLSGAFGGSAGSATDMFGAKAGDVLTWFTVVCFLMFLVLAMELTWTMRPNRDSPTAQVVNNSGQTTAVPPAEDPPLGTPDGLREPPSDIPVPQTQPSTATSDAAATEPEGP